LGKVPVDIADKREKIETLDIKVELESFKVDFDTEQEKELFENL
jgi:hypothetical protein